LRYYAARSILAAMTSRPRTDEAAGGRSNDPPVLILTSLADGEKHGYALLQDIEAFAGVRLGPGTLYGAISRLEERGLIQAAAASGRRRPYRLTAAGAEALRGALADLRTIVDEGSARLARRPAPVALHSGVTA
jgi:DNA-binding PadR family transcriptional regulator